MNILEDTAQGISSMRIRGAGRIARAAAEALMEHAKLVEAESPEEFRQTMLEAARHLLATRPTAVSLKNGLLHSLKGLKIQLPGDGASADVEALRTGMIEAADRFIAFSNGAVAALAEHGSKRIKDGFTMMTICNSSAAVGVITKAHRDGKKIKVYACETRPKRQGLITVRELAAAGIDVTLIVDSAARTYMKQTDLVFVGADTVTAQGNVVNKIGTSQVALCAQEARVPFFVCAESYKFSMDTLEGDLVEIEEREPEEIADPSDFPGVKFGNPVFDITPAKYINAIITESGLIPPQGAYDVVKTLKEELDDTQL